MSSQAAMSLNPKAKSLANLRPWKPGQTGNPKGRPGRMAEMRALALENLPEAVQRLKTLINSPDDRLAFEAIQFTYLYAFGKPAESAELTHLETVMARRMGEVTVEPTQIPETPAQDSLPEAVPVVVGPPEGAAETKEVVSPPVVVPEAAGDLGVQATSVPSGLRCLYRDKSGQCEALAADGVQWCNPHRQKLFEAIT